MKVPELLGFGGINALLSIAEYSPIGSFYIYDMLFPDSCFVCSPTPFPLLLNTVYILPILALLGVGNEQGTLRVVCVLTQPGSQILLCLANVDDLTGVFIDNSIDASVISHTACIC